MTTLAAKIFRMCLTSHLDAPFGANLAPGNSAAELAREFNDGLAGLLRSLSDEAAGGGTGIPLHSLLAEVWMRAGDDQHLKAATGKTRQEWLGAPLWCAYTGA